MTRLAEYRQSRELTVNLVLRELRSRYKRTALGYGWSLLSPLASVAIYGVVFSVFLKVEPPVGDPSGLHSFVLFLVCGLLPWNYFSNCSNASLDALLANANLIRKVYFPRELLVVSATGALLVTYLIELGVLCVILVAVGSMVLPWIPVLLVLVALQAVLVLGVGLALSVLNVYFRDVKHFMILVLMALFYSVPVVYPVTLVPVERTILGVDVPIRFIYELNPLVRMIECYRAVLYDLRFPPLGSFLYFAASAVVFLVAGLVLFSRMDGRLAEEV
ncbi:MAG: ABC transporter permease [Acidimicrobiia bacterium]|jgi:ABC-2 type transport system permease protein